MLMAPKASYLTGVELKDAVAGWRADLIEDIRSSGGLQPSRRDVFQVVRLKLHTANQR